MARAIPKKRLTKKDVKAKADRAEAKSKGEEVKAEASPLEPEVTTKKTGRPSKYDPAFCETAIECGRMGGSKAQIARDIGVSRQTVENWAKEHPEFLDSLKEARELELAWWEDQGRKGMWGGKDGFNATAFIFQMKNRFREDYRDTTAHEMTGRDGAPIEVKDTSDLEVARKVAFMLGKAVAKKVDSGAPA